MTSLRQRVDAFLGGMDAAIALVGPTGAGKLFCNAAGGIEKLQPTEARRPSPGARSP